MALPRKISDEPATELLTAEEAVNNIPVIQEALGQAYLDLTDKQRALLDELFDQSMRGEPCDIQKALLKVGVSHQVMATLRLKGVWQGMVKLLGRLALERVMTRIPAIVRKVTEQAEDGKAAQQKMALQMAGLLVPESGVAGGYAPVKIVRKFMVQEKDGKLTASAEISTEETA
jgi:hypothetical protein